MAFKKKVFSVQRSAFRKDDPTRTKALNTEHLKRLSNAIPNRISVLRFEVGLNSRHKPPSLTVRIEKVLPLPADRG